MFADTLTASVAGVADSATPLDLPLRAAGGAPSSCWRPGARSWGPTAYPGRAEGRVGKNPGKKKKTAQWFFLLFWGFLFFFIYLPRRESF